MTEDLQHVTTALQKAQGSLHAAYAGQRDMARVMADTCAALLAWLDCQVQREQERQEAQG